MAGYDRSRIVGISSQDLDQFICGICHDIFNTPVVTQCCRQTYCKECIEEWLSDQDICPNDRRVLTDNDLIPASRLVLNLLNNMKIKCDFEEKGCPGITTIGELSKHMEECDYKPDINCMTCGLNKADGEEHNCVADLVIKNNSIADELKRLRKENKELKKINQSMTMGMSTVLESARKLLNQYVIVLSYKIEPGQQRFLIDICKIAITTRNNYLTICQFLNFESNESLRCASPRYWQAVVFSNEGGESTASTYQILIIRFGKLVIKLFN